MSDILKTLFDFKNPRTLILHFAWLAFCMTFIMWLELPHIKADLIETFQLTEAKFKALLVLNVALTIPARVVIGMLTDKFGPRYVFGFLLIASAVICSGFALAQSYEQLAFARFLMGFIGAGFVVGTRLVAEWFPAKQVGFASGIYGGWGGVGSAIAGWIIPVMIVYVYAGVEEGWRYALLTVAAAAVVYALIFMKYVRNTPKGSTYFKPKKVSGLEVTSRGDFYYLIAMNLPMVLCLALSAWTVSSDSIGLLSKEALYACYAVLAGLFAFQTYQIYQVNKDMLANGVDDFDRYKFNQVGILNFNYMVSFGSELAIALMLTGFLKTNGHLTTFEASMYFGVFTGLNFIARPLGGYLSDNFGRRKLLVICAIGMVVTFYGMSRVTPDWSFPLIIAMVMLCSLFVHAGTGAVYAVVPLVKRRLSGQISGMVGAYGNVGSSIFILVFTFVEHTSTFFLVMCGCAVVATVWSFFLEEPKGHIIEVLPDGTVQKIEVG